MLPNGSEKSSPFNLYTKKNMNVKTKTREKHNTSESKSNTSRKLYRHRFFFN